MRKANLPAGCCILSKFYIKPQPFSCRHVLPRVVSYRNSTSNHNFLQTLENKCEVVSYRNSTSNHNDMAAVWGDSEVVSYRNSTSNHNHAFRFRPFGRLYLIEILHQTTTTDLGWQLDFKLYLIEILHQTTTNPRPIAILPRCILSKFYIKPQRGYHFYVFPVVVSYRNSTSNHNCLIHHNLNVDVVSYRNSTSNHNVTPFSRLAFRLYLIEILHQTTTVSHVLLPCHLLYLIEILHQTTTGADGKPVARSCILSKFYIKPQPQNNN